MIIVTYGNCLIHELLRGLIGWQESEVKIVLLQLWTKPYLLISCVSAGLL